MTRPELKEYISSQFSTLLTENEAGRYDLLYDVKPDQLVEVCKKLRDDDKLSFDYLCNMHGVDTGEKFEVCYQIASVKNKHRLDLKLTLAYEGAEVDSVCSVWPGANWFEREMWELYGINVHNHNNLKRFLLPDDWDEGHPMRKNWEADDFIKMPDL